MWWRWPAFPNLDAPRGHFSPLIPCLRMQIHLSNNNQEDAALITMIDEKQVALSNVRLISHEPRKAICTVQFLQNMHLFIFRSLILPSIDACKEFLTDCFLYLLSLMTARWHPSKACLSWLCKQNTVLFLCCVVLDGAHGPEPVSHVSWLAAPHQRTLLAPWFLLCVFVEYTLGNAWSSVCTFTHLQFVIAQRCLRLFHFSSYVFFYISPTTSYVTCIK